MKLLLKPKISTFGKKKAQNKAIFTGLKIVAYTLFAYTLCLCIKTA